MEGRNSGLELDNQGTRCRSSASLLGILAVLEPEDSMITIIVINVQYKHSMH